MDELSRMVAGLQADYANLAARQSATEALLRAHSVADLEARLQPGSIVVAGSRGGGLDIPSEVAGGQSLVDRLRADAARGGYVSGRIDPFAGRANILDDPALERMFNKESTTIVFGAAPSWTALGAAWRGRRTFTGAGSPDAAFITYLSRESAGRSSSELGFLVDWSAATAAPVTALVEVSSHLVTPASTPWLVGAVRLTGLAVNVAGEAYLRLYQDDLGVETLVAESDPVVLADNQNEEVRLTCAYGPIDSSDGFQYRLAIEIELSAASIASTATYDFAISEPLLSESDTEDPTSFSPAIGTWIPDRIYNYSTIDGLSDPLIVVSDSDREGETVFQVLPTGAIQWNHPADDTITLLLLDPTGKSGGRSLVPVCLAADTSSNSTSPTTWASFAVQAGRRYAIDLFIWYDVTSTAQGCRVGVRHPGGLVQGLVQTFGQGSPTGSTIEAINAAVADTDVLTTVTGTDGTTGRHIRFQANYTCDTDGTFRLRFALSDSPSSPGVTIRAGSGGMVAVSAL